MTVNAINGKAFTDLSAVDGRTLSTLSHVNGQEIEGFSPIDIASLDWWLIGDNAVDAADFDWPDSSTGNRPYGQNTDAQEPSINAGAYNGHDGVTFGATGRCAVGDPSERSYGTDNTLICVCTKATSNDQYILKGDNVGGQGSPAFISRFSSKDFEYYNDFGGGNIERATFAASADTALHILTITRTDSSGNYIGYYDGTQVFSNAIDADCNWNGNACSIIGAFIAGSTTYGGDIVEILHFNENLAGTSDLTDVHDYLKTKYAIP